jgi:hypothetical protein
MGESRGNKYVSAPPEIRSLGRDLLMSAPVHDRSLIRPGPGQKANIAPASAERRHLSASGAVRTFLPEPERVRKDYSDRPIERR